MLKASHYDTEPWNYKQHVTGKKYGNQWNRIEDAKIYSCSLDPPDCWWRHQKYVLEKRQHFQEIVQRNLDILMRKNETWSVSFTLTKKINSEWIKGLNVRYETLKLLDENTLRCRYEQRISEKHPSRSGNKAKTRQMGLHEITKLLHSRGSSRVRSQLREQKDTFQKSQLCI